MKVVRVEATKEKDIHLLKGKNEANEQLGNIMDQGISEKRKWF